MKRPLTYLCNTLMVFAMLSGCKKEVSSNLLATDTFLKVYSIGGDQAVWHLKETDDKGFLMICCDNDSFVLQKADAKGELQWRSKLTDIDFRGIWACRLNDGGMLFSSQGYNGSFCKIDKNGSIQFAKKFWDNQNNTVFFGNSIPVPLLNGHTLVPYTNGGSTGAASDNKLAHFNELGNLLETITIPDSSFKSPGDKSFKVIGLSLYRCEQVNDYYFTGLAFVDWNSSWSARTRFFISHQVYDSQRKLQSSKTTVLDPVLNPYSNYWFSQLATADGGALVGLCRANRNDVTEANMIKLSKDGTVEWQTVLQVGAGGTNPDGISLGSDGSYIVTGSCNLPGKSSAQPFACKLSKSGVVQWTKIYSTLVSGMIRTVIQLQDGSYIMGGYTNGFGASATLNDAFIIKTDAEGNLK